MCPASTTARDSSCAMSCGECTFLTLRPDSHRAAEACGCRLLPASLRLHVLGIAGTGPVRIPQLLEPEWFSCSPTRRSPTRASTGVALPAPGRRRAKLPETHGGEVIRPLRRRACIPLGPRPALPKPPHGSTTPEVQSPKSMGSLTDGPIMPPGS